MIDYRTPRFKTSQVALAAGITHGAMRSYFSRGHWRVIGAAAKGDGLPNLFSLHDAMTFAIAARLIAATNASADVAFKIAVFQFVHVGDESRRPGSLFNYRERGETLLLYWPDTKDARLIAGDDIQSVYSLTRHGVETRHAATIISLNPIENHVFSTLGIKGNSWSENSGQGDETGEFVEE